MRGGSGNDRMLLIHHFKTHMLCARVAPMRGDRIDSWMPYTPPAHGEPYAGRGSTHREILEQRDELPKALAILLVILRRATHRSRQDLLDAVGSTESDHGFQVPGVVSVNDGLGGALLRGQGGHSGCGPGRRNKRSEMTSEVVMANACAVEANVACVVRLCRKILRILCAGGRSKGR